MIESFWGRMQVELLNRQKWSSIVELSTAMVDYIDSFHNEKRRHSSLDMNRPGFVGDFILWKRGWNHGQTQQDRSKVFG